MYLNTCLAILFRRRRNKLLSSWICNLQSSPPPQKKKNLTSKASLPPSLSFAHFSPSPSLSLLWNGPISYYNADWQWWGCQNVTTLSAVQPSNCQPSIQECGPSDQHKTRRIWKLREGEGEGKKKKDSRGRKIYFHYSLPHLTHRSLTNKGRGGTGR